MGALVAPSRKDALTLDQLGGFLMGPESGTGVSVTWSTALQVSAMFACAQVVGEDIAMCRARLMRPRKNRPGADVASDHPLHRLLFLEPREGFTAFDFWQTIVLHLMFVGNAYVFVNRMGDGRIHELVLLEPQRVTVTHLADLTLRYEVAGEDGALRSVPASSIWHIRGPSWNGWMGLESVRVAREALGLSLALEAGHARMHKHGVQPSGFYAVEGELDNVQYKQLATWLKKFAAGGEYAGQAMILDRGAKWLSQQMTGVDAQHLETRRFEIEEVCRFNRVLPIMIGMADKTATYASAEQMFLAHEVHTLAPKAGRLEQSAEVSLLTPAEKAEGLFVRFNLSAKRRGDYKSRQEGLAIQRRNGVINANEWRDIENMNPREDDGGDQYIVEANMALQDGRDLPPPKAATSPGEKA
jgi:HK97 family phage portal protein